MPSKSKHIILEACVETLQQAKQAQANGANQIELCANLEQDGLSPSTALIKECLHHLSIPIKIMVRPNPGPFIATENTMDIMLKEIQQANQLGVHGVVFGLLNEHQQLAIEQTKKLIDSAGHLEITIHKAIDETKDIIDSIHQLNALNHPLHILTSGGQKTALEGCETINKMIALSKDKIQIMAAGKITAKNLKAHTNLLNTHLFHGRKIV